MAFGIFDPCKLPEKKEDFIQYANKELQDLGEHHGTRKVNRLEGKVNAQDADIDTTALTAEWPLLKSIMFETHLSNRNKVNVQQLIKERGSYTLQKLWDDLKHDNLMKDLSQVHLPASLGFDFPYQHSLCGSFAFMNEACENMA